MNARTGTPPDRGSPSILFKAIKVSVGLGVLCLLAGCASPKKKQWDGPRIFSIGRQATLSFDRQAPLAIPVEGLALASGFRYRVDATLSGTYPISPEHFRFDASPFRTNANVLSITLGTNYLANVETGDILDVAVHVHELAPVDALTSAIAEATRDLGTPASAQGFADVQAAGDYFLNVLAANTNHVNNNHQEQLTRMSMELRELLEGLRQSYTNYAVTSRRLDMAAVANVRNLLSLIQKDQAAAWKDLTHRSYSFSDSTYGDEVRQMLNRQWTPDPEGTQRLIRELEDYDKELAALSALQPWSTRDSTNALQTLRTQVQAASREIQGLARERQVAAETLNSRIEVELKSREVLSRIQSSVLLVGDLLPRILRGSTRSVSTASRTFTFYEFEDFRQDYHGKRVLPSDIMAFPEPAESVEKLFGKSISRRYFVVRLSVRNTEDEDRLIATGMIRARGRAMVESMAGKKRNSYQGQSEVERFTVPVEVAPSSVQQVYAALTDKSAWSTRAVVFRSLELAGTVASAYSLTFGSSETVKDAIQLATGVGIPAFNKFWTDQLPGYQRNIVNFGMPELVKVPRGGVTSHKFLFFPKEAIEGMIIDHNSYGTLEGPWYDRNAIISSPEAFRQPFAAVAYLTFDNLEIPFENVFEPGSDTDRQALLQLRADLTREVSTRIQIRDNWVADRPGSRFENSRLTIERTKGSGLTDPATVVKAGLATWGALDPSGDAQLAQLKTTITNALTTVESLRLVLLPASAGADGPLLGRLPTLELGLGDLDDMSSALMSGKPLGPYRPRFEEIENETRSAEQVLAFYRKAASLLADDDLIASIPGASPQTDGSVDRTKAGALAANLQSKLVELAGMRSRAVRDARLVESLKEFEPAE